jgi:NitT/TauT family transport system substrate-binding protein
MRRFSCILSRVRTKICGLHARRGNWPIARIIGRRRFGRMAAVLAGLALALPTAAWSADSVTFKLDFSPVGYHAPFYAGVSRGVYQSHGLAVDIIPGNGSYPAVLDLAGGKTDFAFADTSLLALAALQGGLKNVKVVAMVFEVTPYSVLYLKNKGIAKPTDLAGKTEANFQGSGVGRIFRAFARINGVDISGVKEILTAPATYLNPLVVGQADFAPSTVNQFVNLRAAAGQEGNDLAEFRFVDYGIDMYGAALLANTDTIAKRGDVVKRFVQASLESIQWAGKNPGTAIDEMLKSNPQLNKERALEELRVILSVSIPRALKVTDPLQLGWVDADKMARTIALVREAYGLTQTVAPDELYTNEFVVKP